MYDIEYPTFDEEISWPNVIQDIVSQARFALKRGGPAYAMKYIPKLKEVWWWRKEEAKKLIAEITKAFYGTMMQEADMGAVITLNVDLEGKIFEFELARLREQDAVGFVYKLLMEHGQHGQLDVLPDLESLIKEKDNEFGNEYTEG